GKGPNRLDHFRKYFGAVVAPTVVDVGEHVGDLLVVEAELGHDAVVDLSVDGDGTLQTMDHRRDGAVHVGVEVIGRGERREGLEDALAFGLVTGHADLGVDYLAAFDALLFARRHRLLAGLLRDRLDGSA